MLVTVNAPPIFQGNNCDSFHLGSLVCFQLLCEKHQAPTAQLHPFAPCFQVLGRLYSEEDDHGLVPTLRGIGG
jgi:hypothetical protein